MSNSNYIKEIGLDVWGCKGGYKSCLFSNGVVNVEDEDIAQTVLDIRKYVRFLRPNVDFYALEFTPKYKVFTKYRSSNDSGDGAFIAITLYVPHERQFRGIRIVLDEMMNTYWNEYMDLDGRHLQGKYYDIAIMQAIIDAHADDIITETGKYRRGRSKRTETPQLLLYDKVEDVDFFFSTPYREAFRSSQEITFVCKESLDPVNYDDYRPEVADYLHKIEKGEIGEQEPESLLLPFEVEGTTLVRLLIDGTDVTAKIMEDGYPLTEGQTIEIELSKGRNYENYYYRNTTEEAVSDGVIVPSGRNYKVSKKISFNPKRKIIAFRCMNTSCDADKLVPLLVLKASNGKNLRLKYDDGKLSMTFLGEAMYKSQKLLLQIREDKLIYKELAAFVPNETTEVMVDVSEVEIKIDRNSVVKDPPKVDIQCLFGDEEDSVPLSFVAKPYRFYLPRRLADIAQYKFDISLNNYEFDRNSMMLKIEPKFDVVEIDTSNLGKYGKISSLSLNIYLDGEKHTANYDNQSCKLKFVLPYRWREMEIDRIESNGLDVDYEVSKKGIVLKGKFVINGCKVSKSISLIVADSGRKDTLVVWLDAGKCMLVPQAYEVEEELGSDYILSQKDKDRNLVYYVLQQIEDGSGMKASGKIQKTPVNADVEESEETETKPVKVYLYNCDSLSFRDKDKGLISVKTLKEDKNKGCRIIPIQPVDFHLRDKDKNEICVIIFPKDKYEQNKRIKQDNEKNGFRVEWEGCDCHIYYEPGFGLFFKNFTRSVRRNLRIILPISLLLLATVGGVCFWFNSKQIKIKFIGDVQKISVSLTDSTKSYFEIDGNTLVIKDPQGIKNNVDVSIYFDKDANNPDETIIMSKTELMAMWEENRDSTIEKKKPSAVAVKKSPVLEEKPYTEDDRQNDSVLIAEAKALLEDVDSRTKWFDKRKKTGVKIQYDKIISQINNKNEEKHELEEAGKAFDNFFIGTFKTSMEISKINQEDVEKLAQASVEFKEKGYKYLSDDNKSKFDATYGKPQNIEILCRHYQSVNLYNSIEAPKINSNGGGSVSEKRYNRAKMKKKLSGK